MKRLVIEIKKETAISNNKAYMVGQFKEEGIYLNTDEYGHKSLIYQPEDLTVHPTGMGFMPAMLGKIKVEDGAKQEPGAELNAAVEDRRGFVSEDALIKAIAVARDAKLIERLYSTKFE